MTRIMLVVVFVACAPELARASNCSVTATSIAFGSYDVFSAAPLDSVGTISYRCLGNANATITISRGQSSTFGPRILAKGAERLSYNLFLDAARTIVWGDASGGTQPYVDGDAPNNQTVTIPIYGRIPADQDVSAGVYSDTVVAI